MLYLAKVHKNEFLVQSELRLLARQETENMWAMNTEEAVIVRGKGKHLTEKLRVLVELSSTGEI